MQIESVVLLVYAFELK